MDDVVVTIELTKAELLRLINALHELIDTEHEAGREPADQDQILLAKLVQHF
jgi:siroheme synthase